MSITKGRISGVEFIKSIFKFSISSWVNFVISILSVIITTRIFSPEIYGNLSMFNTTSSLLMGVVCLGLDSSFMRFFNEPPDGSDTKQLLAKCMGIPLLVLSILTIVIVPFFYKEISSFLFNKISLIVVLLLSINCFSLLILNFFSICYRISNNARLYTIQSILIQIVTKFLIISAILINPTFEMVVGINTVGLFILTVVYFFAQKSVLPRKIDWSLKGYSEVFNFALYSWPIVILIYSGSFFSQMIINSKLGSYQLGIYASTGFFISALAVVQSGFKTYWATFMYGNYKTEQSTIIKVHDYVVIFAILILSGFIVSQNLIYRLLGNDYQASRYFFTLIMVSPLFNLISETTTYGITIAKKTKYNLIIYIVATALNLGLGIMLINIYGIVGIGIALVISETVKIGLSSIIGQKFYKSINNPMKTIVSLVVILILASSNCFFADDYFIVLFIIVIMLLLVGFIYKNEISDVYKTMVFELNKRKII